MSQDWFSEDNLARTVCEYLLERGWSLVKIAGTAKLEYGHILAQRNHETLILDIKVFPSTTSANGMPKTTISGSRVRRWYNQVLLSAILTQSDYPDAIVGITLPSFTSQRKLIQRIREAFNILGFVVYVVTEDGEVETLPDARILNPTL